MDTIEKLHFVFSIFDFSSSAELNAEAAALMIRTVVSGLNKVAVFLDNPTQEQVDKAAALMIASAANPNSLTIAEYQKYCTSDLIFTSWIRCYSCVEPVRVSVGLVDTDLTAMMTVPELTPHSASSSKYTRKIKVPIAGANRIR